MPKTGGSSFRAGLRYALDGTATEFSIRNVQASLKKQNEWPIGFSKLLERELHRGHIIACASHYTGLARDIISERILAIVRDPEKQFWSAIRFRAAKWNGMSAESVVSRVANMQFMSLSGKSRKHIPLERPNGLELSRWERRVAKLIKQYKLLPLEQWNLIEEYCAKIYEIDLPYLHKKETKGRDPLDTNLEGGIKELTNSRDYLWLDRILYEAVAK